MQFPEAIPFYQNVIGAFFDNAINYFLFTVPPFVLFWMWGKSYFQKIRIQWVKRAFTHHIRHDLMYSMLSFGIFALLNGFVLYQLSRGHTLIFTDWSQTNPVIWVATFLFVLVIDDMFFYWSHRWMHNPKIYGRVHRVHHESTDTSPFTAYAFHPLEALIEGITCKILTRCLQYFRGKYCNEPTQTNPPHATGSSRDMAFIPKPSVEDKSHSRPLQS